MSENTKSAGVVVWENNGGTKEYQPVVLDEDDNIVEHYSFHAKPLGGSKGKWFEGSDVRADAANVRYTYHKDAMAKAAERIAQSRYNTFAFQRVERQNTG